MDFLVGPSQDDDNLMDEEFLGIFCDGDCGCNKVEGCACKPKDDPGFPPA